MTVDPARVEPRSQAVASDEGVMKARPFPVQYDEQQPFPLEVAPGRAGVVVVMPEGINANNRMDFRVTLIVGRGEGSVSFVPRGRGMMLIDVNDVLNLDKETLKAVVHKKWIDGGGRPPPPEEVNSGNG